MTNAGADSLSEIPDELIHRIYYFLDMKEVVGTTLLSKRWRCVWRSLTNLNFNQHVMCSIEDKKTPNGSKKSWEFVEQVLLCRDCSDIQKLCLSNYSCDRKRLLAWLDYAVKHHVQEIHLENTEAPYSFAGEVKTLVLKNCKYTPQPFLLSSRGLNHLTVENSACYMFFYKISICAPNLTTLQLKGNMFDGYNMDNLSALLTAEIDVNITDLYSKSREVSKNSLSHIFSGIRNVEFLTLPTHCFKFLPGLFDGLEPFPFSFNNLKHLKLSGWRERSYIGVMSKLCRCFPNLEILILERAEACGSEDEGDREAESLSDIIFGHLKVVEIRKFDGSKKEYKFLEFLLNNALVLEHITMKVTKNLSEEKAKELVDFIKKLHVMLRASPCMRIRLMMKIEGRYTILYEEPSSFSESPLLALDSLSLST